MLLTDRIDDIVAELKNGGIILYPSDTIWGLGCNALNPYAVERVYRIKMRERHKPMILLVPDLSMLKKYTTDIHPRVETLLSFHKKPLTIVYTPSDLVPEYLVPDSRLIGIRVVHDPFCIKLIKELGFPMVSTSANISDEPYPKNFGEVSSEIIKNVDYVVKFRQNEKTMLPPSVVASFNDKGDLKFLRT